MVTYFLFALCRDLLVMLVTTEIRVPRALRERTARGDNREQLVGEENP